MCGIWGCLRDKMTRQQVLDLNLNVGPSLWKSGGEHFAMHGAVMKPLKKGGFSFREEIKQKANEFWVSDAYVK